MTARAFAVTDVGRTRDRNEDAFAIDAELGLHVVCDGLGGHAAGEVASREAVDFVVGHIGGERALLRDAETSDGGRFAVRLLVDEAIRGASRELYTAACADPERAGMATTMTLVLLWHGKAIVGHVGDCRCYLLRGGELLRLTRDHTVGAEKVSRGELTAAEAAESPLSHALTRAVGSQSAVLVDTLCLELAPDDAFLLCSDGLYRYLDEAEIADHLRRDDLDGVPADLARLANERGGEDNITAIALRPSTDDARGAERVPQRLDALAAAAPFRGLSLARRARLLEAAEVLRLEAGDTLVEAGGELEGLYVLAHGTVDGLGAEPGATAGERALAGARVTTGALRAGEAAEVLFLHRAAFMDLVQRHPRFGRRLLANLLAVIAAGPD